MVKKIFKVQKINIGALGNIVSQLHIHIVGRKSTDSLWPQPVWGRGPGVVYEQDQLVILKHNIDGFLDSPKP
jgi:diadenosine tetraphosphate (Ap4A) HIT family hydrolase